MKKIVLSILALTMFDANASIESADAPKKNIQLGLAAGWNSGPYGNYSNKINPIPVINFENDIFYLRGNEIGMKMLSSTHNEFDFFSSLNPLHFKPGNAKTEGLKKLDERKYSVMLGLAWIHKTNWGFTSVNFSQRVSGNKNGGIAGASYSYPFNLGKGSIILGAGVDFSTKEMNENYFGVSSVESAKSGIKQYNPHSGYSPYINFLTTYPLTNCIDFSLGARVTRLSNAVYDSPMVNDRYNQSFVSSVTYLF